MGQKLSPRQLALYRAIDEIVWHDWDPIGISQLSDPPRDEYYNYLPRIFSMALGGDRQSLARLLAELTEYIMGLRISPESQMDVLDKILEAKVRCLEGPDEYEDEA